jgi:general secretion pathway protein K
MSRDGAQDRDRAAGFVLVAVLTVMILLSGLIAAVSLVTRSAVGSAVVQMDGLADESLIRAGVDLAAYQLFDLGRTPAALSGQQVRLDAGTVTLFAASESARVDLNTSDGALLAAAYRAAGLGGLSADSFAARVIDWRDADDEMSEGGAEARDYEAAGRGRQPQNDGFRIVDDLRWVLGVSQADVAKLANFVTVYNPGGKLDVFAAPKALLAGLPGISPATVAKIIALRRGRSEENDAALRALIVDQADFVAEDEGPIYRLRLEVRREGRAVRTVEAAISADPSGQSPYFVMDWVD